MYGVEGSFWSIILTHLLICFLNIFERNSGVLHRFIDETPRQLNLRPSLLIVQRWIWAKYWKYSQNSQIYQGPIKSSCNGYRTSQEEQFRNQLQIIPFKVFFSDYYLFAALKVHSLRKIVTQLEIRFFQILLSSRINSKSFINFLLIPYPSNLTKDEKSVSSFSFSCQKFRFWLTNRFKV